ncbi:hypothetical protein UlMin_016127 [Ulmus minor]
MKIRVRKTTIVKPAEKTPRRSVWLSDLDLINNGGHHPFIYFYRPNGDPNFFNPDLLKKALSQVLVPFYPMAGRFERDASGRLEINCNGEGVLFVEAESSSTIADFGDFVPSPQLQTLIPAIDYSSGISSYPFFLSQVTYFKCGGVSLGIGVEYRAADGPAGFQFINTWSDIARGLDLTIPPFFDRTLLRSRNPPQVLFNHIEYQLTPAMKIQMQNTKSPPTKISIFKMSREQLDILKAKANVYSTYEVLTGHIWRCATKARALSGDEETRLYFPTNGRSSFSSRLKPSLPLGYLGCVVFGAVSIAMAGDIQTRPLSYSVSCVHQTLVRMDNDYLRSAIDYLKLNPDTKRHGIHTYKSPNLYITSWVRLPVYDADFGWGRPFYMGPAQMMPEGKSFVFPCASKDGSLFVAMSLEHEHMNKFEKLLYEFDETKRERRSYRANL